MKLEKNSLRIILLPPLQVYFLKEVRVTVKNIIYLRSEGTILTRNIILGLTEASNLSSIIRNDTLSCYGPMEVFMLAFRESLVCTHTILNPTLPRQ